jgi:hypothetical protein
MFVINDDLSIYVTRGDIVFFGVLAEKDGKPYTFKVGDVVRIKVFGKKDCNTVVLQKDFPIAVESEMAEIYLSENDTKIGGVINKHNDYWYEVELNPNSNPQTIIGYDDDGAKIFRLFPEGRDLTEDDPIITPEDIPIIDAELDVLSKRPIENRAVAIAIEKANAKINKLPKVYVADNKQENPADIFGGTWELFDKGFKFSQWRQTISTNSCDATLYCHRNGSCIKILADCTLNTAVTSRSDIVQFDFESMGLNIPVEDATIMARCIVVAVNEELSVAVGEVFVESNGVVFVNPLTLTPDAPTIISKDSSFTFEVTLPAVPSQMLDHYCDKFYWKRID